MRKITHQIIEEEMNFSKERKQRTTVRGIILDKNKILMLYSEMFNDYTLPGGGKKSDENEMMALKRELEEEVGATKIEVIKHFGYVEELRYGLNNNGNIYEQTSLYYICKMIEKGEPKLIEREQAQGIKPVWVDIQEAISHNESVMFDHNHQQQGLKTVLQRENAVLKMVLEQEVRYFKVVEAYKEKQINIPQRQTSHSAGYDFEIAEDVSLNPGDIKLVPTGIKAFFPKHEALFIYPRSSLALKKKVMMANNVGVVDSDYYDNPNNEGHIFIPLYNFSNEKVEIKKGERIAQGIFQRYETVNDDTANGKRIGGFGSSDKNKWIKWLKFHLVYDIFIKANNKTHVRCLKTQVPK